MLFRRKFAVSLYKNLKLRLAAVDFSKDVAETDRANKYPLMSSTGEYTEKVCGGRYYFDGGSLTRYVFPLYPNAMNEVTVGELSGECGFVFEHGNDTLKFTLNNSDKLCVCFECDGKKEKIAVDGSFRSGMRFAVLERKNLFDIYIKRNDYAEYICTFEADEFSDCSSESFFKSTSVGLYFSGKVVCTGAEAFDDSGIAQADIRPVCYENGDVITENGRVFLTASLRAQAGGCQGVLSWIPGTAEFELVGTLFFNTGDGRWENDVA